jgi:hypothetical protein
MDGPSPDNGGFGPEATARPPKRRRRPEWADWAYPLAHALRELWPWLKYEPLHLVVSTLGARLGPRWGAGDVVDFVDRDRAGRPLPVDKHTPVGLLRELLEEALTGRLQPPYPARRRTEHDQELTARRHAAAVAEAERRRAATRLARAEHTAGARTGAATAGRGAALARAALAQAAGSRRNGAAAAER